MLGLNAWFSWELVRWRYPLSGQMMSDPHSQQIESYLAIDVVKEDKAYARARQLRVGQRYFAGLLKVLTDMPDLEGVVLDFSNTQLTINTRTLLDVKKYENITKYSTKATVFEDVDQSSVDKAREFYKRFASTRSALGTTTLTSNALALIVPPQTDIELLSRSQAVWLCKQVLDNPDFRLNHAGRAHMQAEAIAAETSNAPHSRPSGPRL